MKILITFPEIQEIIKNKTGKDITLSMAKDNTVRILYTLAVKVPFIGNVEKDIALNVSIKEIKGTDIYMSYDCGMGMSLMISEALKMLKEDPRLGFIEVGKDKQMVLKLGEMENIKSVFDKIDLQSISVTNSGIGAICKLKEIL